MKKFIISAIVAFFIANPVLTSAFTQTHQFTDQPKDFETGLYNYGAREYDPNIGRFIQQDPLIKDPKVLPDGSINPNFLMTASQDEMNEFLANPQNLNPYSYTRNNPVNYVDPKGEFAETPLDVGFVAYDVGNTLFKASKFISSLFSGELQKASNASQALLGSFIDLGVDTGAALIPFVPAGLNKIDDAVKLVNKAKDFDAAAQQSKMLKGIENSKVINTIKAVFKKSDEIPGGTMGALRNEIMTGNKTKNKLHVDKAWNTINRIENIFKNEKLNKVELNRLQGISNSLKSLIRNVKQ